MKKQKEFGPIRSLLFPIHSFELKKFAQMCFIFICISITYSLVRAKKDIFFMSIPGGGAECIYYVKLVIVMPSVIAFTALYTMISQRLGRDGLIKATLAYFLCFYLIFTFLVLPNADALRLVSLGNKFSMMFPKVAPFGKVLEYWYVALFYLHAELYGTYALQVAFWGFTNAIVNLKQAKRFYGFLGLSANVGAIIAGISLKSIFGNDVRFLLLSIIGLGVACLGALQLFTTLMRKSPDAYQLEGGGTAPKKKKVKMSLGASLAYVMRSRYLMLLSLVVLGYNVTIALFESVWKSSVSGAKLLLKVQDPAFADRIYGEQLILVGMVSLCMVFVASATTHLSWRFKASVTPIIAFIAIAIFFSFLAMSDSLAQFDVVAQLFDRHSPIVVAVYIGLGNVAVLKAVKYIFFDSSKEMAYIPLGDESRTFGKAAVDGIGSRLGKAIGAGLSVLLSILFGGGLIAQARTPIAFTILGVLVVWLIAVGALSIEFNALTKKQEEDAA